MGLHDDNDAFADHDVADWIGNAPDQALIALDQEIVRRGGLKAFLQLAWPVIEGGAEFSDNWHLSAICEHLEAVSSGEIKRLAIAVPPRTGKSGMVSVMFPAWDWIMRPSRRFLFASYAHNLSIRDGTRCRRVLQSPWFQQRWGNRFKITSDQNTKIKFENNKGGYRLSTSVGGQLTGEGGDIVCLPYDQEVLTEHGPMQIGDIVSERRSVRVWAHDVESGRVALKPIMGWHRNPGRQIVRVTLSDGTSFRCTADHKVWTRSGWVEAGNLVERDAFPTLSVPDGVDYGASNAIHLGKFWPADVSRCPDGDHFGVRELATHGAMLPGVISVFRDGSVAEVAPEIVGPCSIEVTDLVSLWAWPTERQHDQSMNAHAAGCCVFADADARVAGSQELLEDLLPHRDHGAVLLLDGPFLAPYPTDAGGAVTPLVPEHRTPFLVEIIGHADVTFCLSVAEYHTMMLPGNVTVSNCIDDANNSVDSESEAVREGTNRWFAESASTRLNSPKHGAFVLIQQRLHERDLMGFVLKKHGMVQDGGEYTMLCLPMEYDPGHPTIWARDPRREAGELLWPEHIPRSVVEGLKNALGPYSAAGQLQQLPSPREGGIFKRSWFPVVNSHPTDLEYARGWDLAATSAQLTRSDPDYTAGVKIGWSRSAKKWYITNIVRFREEPHKVEENLLLTAKTDGHQCRIVIPKDPGQAGKAQSMNLLAMLGGFDVQAEPQTGDKMARAMPLAGQAGGGNVCIVRGAGPIDEFIAEITGFPNASHDDMVDAAASAFTRLTGGTSGLMEFYARQADDQAAKKAEAAAVIQANGGSVPSSPAVVEHTEDFARALILASQRSRG